MTNRSRFGARGAFWILSGLLCWCSCRSRERARGLEGLWTHEGGVMEESDRVEIRPSGAFIWTHNDRTFHSIDEAIGKWVLKGDVLIMTEISRNGKPVESSTRTV